jgi:retinol-binding protein 3
MGIIFAFILLSLASADGQVQTGIPNTPAGRALRSWFAAVNSGKPSRIREYVQQIDATQTADWLVSLSQHSGGFNLLSVTSKDPRLISFSVKEKRSTKQAFGSLRVNNSARLSVSSFVLRLIPENTIVEDVALTEWERRQMTTEVILDLEKYYLYPDVATKMADVLLKEEPLDEEKDGGAFAFSVTKRLRNVSHDRHLELMYTPFRPQPQRQFAASSGGTREQQSECGINRTTILSGNIGYLKLDAFSDPGRCGASLAAAMRSVNNAGSLIVDLRQNHGGDPRMVALVASYLFDRPVHLNDMYSPRSGTTEESWTTSPVPGSNLTHTPVFLLTSAMTFSGGEEFSYDLKMLGRAKIVGERTGGGAHPVNLHRIGERFTFAVPFATPVNPVSKSSWEGIGVTPDVDVDANTALRTAELLAVKKSTRQKSSHSAPLPN